MSLASEVLNEAREVYLNDPNAKLYTDVILLPFLRKAYRDLQQELIDNGVSVARENSSELTLAANTTSITFVSSPALPADLLYPSKLDEKRVGEENKSYIPMTETTWEPDIQKQERLRYWSWRENEIKLVGATATAVVRIKYWKSLAAITSANSEIPIIDSEGFLSARTAAMAALTIGKSTTLSNAFQGEAESELETFLSISVKNRSNQPIRRRGFVAFRGRSYRRYT